LRASHRSLVALGCVALLAASCGDDSTSPNETAAVTSDAAAEVATLDSCGTTLEFPTPPERVVLMEPSYVVVLDAVDALDRVVTTVGDFPDPYFTDEQRAAVDQIPNLALEQSSTGGVNLSLEAVVELEPDLVIGYETETLTAATLAERDIALYTIPPYCDTAPPVSFDSIYAEVERMGSVFQAPDAAEATVTGLQGRLAGFDAEAIGQGRSAAALFVSSDGSAIYAYSRLGMVHPQLEALGFENVFADLPERVPEISLEELIDRNPEALVLLHTDTAATPEQISALVSSLPGAETIAAVQTGTIVPLLFNYSEPPSPLVFEGLDLLATALAP
jgi:iron complex transport system substrate-binding protein